VLFSSIFVAIECVNPRLHFKNPLSIEKNFVCCKCGKVNSPYRHTVAPDRPVRRLIHPPPILPQPVLESPVVASGAKVLISRYSPSSPFYWPGPLILSLACLIEPHVPLRRFLQVANILSFSTRIPQLPLWPVCVRMASSRSFTKLEKQSRLFHLSSPALFWCCILCLGLFFLFSETKARLFRSPTTPSPMGLIFSCQSRRIFGCSYLFYTKGSVQPFPLIQRRSSSIPSSQRIRTLIT